MLNYIFYRIGQFLALRLPLGLSYRVAILISDLHNIFSFKDRRAVRANLKTIFPEKSPKEIRRIRRRISINFAKYLVDFFRFSVIDASYLEENVKIENLVYIDRALSKGKGVIILSAHLGNWELGGVVLGVLGYPFWVVALTHKNKKVNSFFNFQRESKGVRVIPLGKAVRQCLRVLGENKMLGLVGDRDFTERGTVLDFFGRPAIFPQGPAALSLSMGASIVPAFMLRNSDESFTLRFEEPVQFSPSGERERDVKDLIAKYILIYEDYIRRYPDQWYMFRRFWVNR
ncbi:MAG: lysophospholipid acyltransferase family protein [Candidatus Omnitrophica bacterium]|nr:lysophospholipid acyltransferase family protein [Candidatus Omnitrophota bacterium]